MNAQPCTPPNTKIKPKTKPGNRPKKTPEAKAFRKRLRAFRQTIGGNIERIRKADNVPLRTLARKTGYSAVKLDYWEMGRMDISLEAILRIAKALKVPHQQLLAMPDGEGAAPEDIPEENSPIFLTGEDEKHWWGGLEMHLYELVKARERAKVQTEKQAEAHAEKRAQDSAKDQADDHSGEQTAGASGLPGKKMVMAMEEPIYRLTCASVLMRDLAYGAQEAGEPPRAAGLHFFAHALTRETDVLYRLYHGKQPSYD